MVMLWWWPSAWALLHVAGSAMAPSRHGGDRLRGHCYTISGNGGMVVVSR